MWCDREANLSECRNWQKYIPEILGDGVSTPLAHGWCAATTGHHCGSGFIMTEAKSGLANLAREIILRNCVTVFLCLEVTSVLNHALCLHMRCGVWCMHDSKNYLVCRLFLIYGLLWVLRCICQHSQLHVADVRSFGKWTVSVSRSNGKILPSVRVGPGAVAEQDLKRFWFAPCVHNQ